jgi:L-lactate dehydrogenase (cytochrome)
MCGISLDSLLATQGVQEVSLHPLANRMRYLSCFTVIYKHAGRDATEAYSSIHSPSTIKKSLPINALKGILDKSTITKAWAKSLENATANVMLKSDVVKQPLLSIINADDFELAAKYSALPKTWAY